MKPRIYRGGYWRWGWTVEYKPTDAHAIQHIMNQRTYLDTNKPLWPMIMMQYVDTWQQAIEHLCGLYERQLLVRENNPLLSPTPRL